MKTEVEMLLLLLLGISTLLLLVWFSRTFVFAVGSLEDDIFFPLNDIFKQRKSQKNIRIKERRNI